MKKNSGACHRNPELVLEMNRKGCSLTAIGLAVGTNKRHVKKFLREHGETREFPFSKKGQECSKWTGGRNIDKDGYVMIYCPDHPNRRKHTPYIAEHRLVMEMHIGRLLLKNEVVHHRNKNKADNRIENLELFSSNALHLKSELTGQVPKWTPDGAERIRKSVLRRWRDWREKNQNQTAADAQPCK